MDALSLQQGFGADDFYRACYESPQGLTQADLMERGWDTNAIMAAANACLGDGRVRLVKLGQNQFLYQAEDPRTFFKYKDLTKEHRLVLQLIEKSAERGTWPKKLKDASQLEQHTVTRITKDLLKRQLIKEVKVAGMNPPRKVFLAWDVEPLQEISGGMWYQDGKFSTSWIESLREKCMQYLEQNAGNPVSLRDLQHNASQACGSSGGHAAPNEDHIQSIMRSLHLEEEVFMKQTREGEFLYYVPVRADRGPFDLYSAMQPEYVTMRTDPAWMRPQVGEQLFCPVPCLTCHLTDQCQPGARISPESCDYLNAWQSNLALAPDVDMEDISMNFSAAY